MYLLTEIYSSITYHQSYLVTVYLTSCRYNHTTTLTCLTQTGNNELFKYVTGTSNTVRLQIDNKDRNGDSPLLILLKSGKSNTPSGEALYNLLMKYGASNNIRDASGKQPIDYVEPGTRIYDDLRNGANSYKGGNDIIFISFH